MFGFNIHEGYKVLFWRQEAGLLKRDLRVQEVPEPEPHFYNSYRKDSHKGAKCLQRQKKRQQLPSVSIFHLQVYWSSIKDGVWKWWNSTELLGSWEFRKSNTEPQTERRWETRVYVAEITELPDSVIAVSGLSALLLPRRLLSSSSPLSLLNETHHKCNDAGSIPWHETLKYNNLQHSLSVWFHVLVSCSSQQIDDVGRLVQMLFFFLHIEMSYMTVNIKFKFQSKVILSVFTLDWRRPLMCCERVKRDMMHYISAVSLTAKSINVW